MTRATAVASENGTRSAATAISVSELVVRFDGDAGSVTALDKLDIFSRYAVGWMVADRENSALAARLIEQTCHKQGVQPQVLTLHSDRGAPMTSKCTAQLLADLGVTRSLSRPQVSDDNPFSEAQFKTLKYHPGFPGRFHDLTAAITFCRSFFPWYNTEHRHAGIAMLTPDDVHHHRAHSVLEQRERTLQAAWTRHPERFVRGVPQPDVG